MMAGLCSISEETVGQNSDWILEPPDILVDQMTIALFDQNQETIWTPSFEIGPHWIPSGLSFPQHGPG